MNVYDAVGNHDWTAQDIEITASGYFDYDGDGYYGIGSGGDDCDDDDASINPGAIEVLNDGIDQDCDGEDATVEERKWYVFKLSGVGYHKAFSSRLLKLQAMSIKHCGCCHQK